MYKTPEEIKALILHSIPDSAIVDSMPDGSEFYYNVTRISERVYETLIKEGVIQAPGNAQQQVQPDSALLNYAVEATRK